MKVNLNQLYYFKKIATLQHFRQASQQLNISQPSLSYAISALEDELGVKLFEKQGRNVVLTKYGKIYLEYVDKALSILDSGEKKIKQITSARNGHIDIAYISPLASHYIPKIVKDFLDINKNITFSFRQGITKDLISGLKNSEYDIIFCSDRVNEKNIVFKLIYEDELILIVNKNHELAKFKRLNLQSIKDYPIISYEKQTALGKYTNKIFDSIDLQPKIICECEDENGIYGFVSEGFGVALTAKTSQIDKFENIVQIKLKNNTYKRKIYIAYKDSQIISPAVKTFINHILQQKTNIVL